MILQLLQKPNLSAASISQAPGAPQSPKSQHKKFRTVVDEYDNHSRPDMTDVMENCSNGNDTHKNSKVMEDPK